MPSSLQNTALTGPRLQQATVIYSVGQMIQNNLKSIKYILFAFLIVQTNSKVKDAKNLPIVIFNSKIPIYFPTYLGRLLW